MENQYETEIDLLDLLYYLGKKIWILVAATLIFAVAGATLTMYVMDEQYTAETRLYVLNRSSGSALGGLGAALAVSDFQISDNLLEDYLVLLSGRNITDEVLEILNLDMTREELSKLITVQSINNTRVFKIQVTDTDPQRAANIANCVREVAARQLESIMDVNAVNLVYDAEVPQKKSGPSVTKNTMIAALLGLMAAAGIFVVIYLLDDTIRTEEDVERHLGLSVLGVIPLDKEMSNMAMISDFEGKGNRKRAKKILHTKEK